MAVVLILLEAITTQFFFWLTHIRNSCVLSINTMCLAFCSVVNPNVVMQSVYWLVNERSNFVLCYRLNFFFFFFFSFCTLSEIKYLQGVSLPQQYFHDPEDKILFVLSNFWF